MKSKFSLLKDWFSFTEQPLTYWGLSWRYTILGPVYAMFWTLHNNVALFFGALLGTVVAGVAEYFTGFGSLGAFTAIILFLFLWMMSSLVSDVKRRQKSDIKIESKSENKITLSYTLTAVNNPRGTCKFDSTATLIYTDDGWKLETMNNKLRK